MESLELNFTIILWKAFLNQLKKRRGYGVKLKKKAIMIMSFSLGTLLFATTALAEVTSKSGYDQVKDAMKFTTESWSSRFNNFTMEISSVVKDNDKIIASQSDVTKFDRQKGARETKSSTMNYKNEKSDNYNYIDKEVTIDYYSDGDKYFISKNKSNYVELIKNPFKEPSAGDVEKIADAALGSLKDYVIVTEKADGSKEMSGSLSEAQIPAIINAITSFEFKNSFSWYNIEKPGEKADKSNHISSDVFVKNAKGTIIADKNGIIKSLLAAAELSGKDEDGQVHTVSFELLMKLYDVNSTVLNRPDLTGKNVEDLTMAENDTNQEAVVWPDFNIYLGKYKQDIVLNKDGKLKKIGEKTINFESVNKRVISGTYVEEYKKGYEQYITNKSNLKFEASFEYDPHYSVISFFDTYGNNIKAEMILNSPIKIYVSYLDETEQKSEILSDKVLSRIFD